MRELEIGGSAEEFAPKLEDKEKVGETRRRDERLQQETYGNSRKRGQMD